MRVVFAGTPQAAVPSLRTLLQGPHDVVAVVTRPDKPAGRGRHVAVSPVKAAATEAGVEVLQPARADDPEFLQRLRQLAPDCCPVVAYGALLRQEALDIPQNGWVNLHFSLLPAWRGAAPVQRALMAGDEVTGASTFRIEAGLDTGPVFGTVTVEIDPRDTSGTLLDRLADAGASLLAGTLDAIADGRAEPRPQPADGVSLAPKVTVEDAQIDWSWPALHVDRVVRACTPAPGAWTIFRGRRMKLQPVRCCDAGVFAEGAALPPGRVAVARGSVLVGTGSLPVLLGDVQPEGKPAMAATDWARGVRLTEDDHFG